MPASLNGRSRVRFGQFEADLAEHTLLKRDRAVRLENKPFQVLAALLDRHGEVITREELRAKLWRDGTHVDFDEGLNTAIKKLRFALGDSPDVPVFIETIPRRGYRFLAPIEIVAAETSAPVDGNLPISTETAPLTGPATVPETEPFTGEKTVAADLRWRKRAATLVVLCLLGCSGHLDDPSRALLANPPREVVEEIAKETGNRGRARPICPRPCHATLSIPCSGNTRV